MEKMNLTLQQQNIWEMIKRYEGSCIGNIGGILHMRADIDENMIYRTICRVQYLNPALRLCIDAKGMQYLSNSNETDFEALDYSEHTFEECEERIQQLMNIPVFGYDKIMVRYYFIKCKEQNYLFGIYHHLLCDGVGLQRVTDQLYRLSHNEQDPCWDKERLPDKRYIEDIQKQDEKIKQYLKGVEWYRKLYENAKLTFPVRRIGKSIEACIFRKEISGESYEDFLALQKRCAYTIEQLYEAAYAIYQSKITGNRLVSIGRILMNRKKSNIDAAGMYANILPLLVEVEEPVRFTELCKQIKRREFEMLKYSNVKWSEAAAEFSCHQKVFDLCISYRPTKRLPRDNQMIARECECNAVEVPLRMLLDEQEDRILITYKYMSELYTEQEVSDINEVLWRIICAGMQEAGEEENTLQAAEAFEVYEILSEREKKRMRLERSIAQAHSQETDMMDLFYDYARRNPKAVMWKDLSENITISYEEAEALTEQLAAQIETKLTGGDEKRQGIQGEAFVIALQLKRTYRMPLTMLACLKAGVVFYPIDINESEKRIKEIQSYVDLIMTDDLLDTWMKEEKREVSAKDKLHTSLAYEINTSGSTGNPKLVQIERQALNIRLAWMKQAYQMEYGTVLQKTKNTFDVSIWELLLPSMAGGTLVILPDYEERDPAKIAAAIIKEDVQYIHFVPSMLKAFLSWVEVVGIEEELNKRLKHLIVSGEALTASLTERVMRLFPDVRIHNLYGPAECTIDVSYHDCDKQDLVNGVMPIGQAVWGTWLEIMNENRQILPDGYIGEIVIGGALVGRGYYNNDEQNKKRFLTADEKNDRVYYTGDMGYRLTNGEIVYVGRNDREVKIRGQRVQLSILENEVMKLSYIKNAAVFTEKNRLILFVEADREEQEIKKALREQLAKHYIPDMIFKIDSIPYNKNGKCDYQQLRKRYEQYCECQASEGNASDDTDDKNKLMESQLLRTIYECFSRVTNNSSIRLDEDIFEWGMDSISVVQLLVELEEEGISLMYNDIYMAKSILGIAQIIEGKAKKQSHQILRRYPEWEFVNQLEEEEKPFKIAIAVPYAGTDVHIFDEFASRITEAGYTFYACDMGKGHENVDEMADMAEKALHMETQKRLTEVLVVGCCVGSALAVEMVKRIQKYSCIKSELVLVGSLPMYYSKNKLGIYAFKENYLLWEVMPKKIIDIIFSGLHGKKVVYSNTMVEQLIREAKIYVDYFEKNRTGKEKVSTETIMIFGEKDYLTLGYQKKYQQWRRYIKGPVKVITIKEGRHFLMESHAKLLAKIIQRQREKNAEIYLHR